MTVDEPQKAATGGVFGRRTDKRLVKQVEFCGILIQFVSFQLM